MIKYDTFLCEEKKYDEIWKKKWINKKFKTEPAGPPLDDEHIKKKVDALLIRCSIEMSVSTLQLKKCRNIEAILHIIH